MEKNIIEGNKLIAKFMNYDDIDCDKCKYNFDCNHLQCCLSPLEKDKLLSYHSDWNWLMPVIEKIEGLKLGTITIDTPMFSNDKYYEASVSFVITSYDCSLHLSGTMKLYEEFLYNKGFTMIGNVFKTIVDFIKWYNKRN